jgi:hypothetical protein
MTLFQGSRYEDTSLFESDESGREIFRGLRARETGKAIGVLEHRVKITDRLDSLAHYYHGESRLWHRLAEANPGVIFPEDLLVSPPEPQTSGMATEEDGQVGRVILIPRKSEI